MPPRATSVPTPTNPPLGRRHRADAVPNVLFCHLCEVDGYPRAWLAYTWEDGCPGCGDRAQLDVRCGARYRPELCRRVVDRNKGGRCCIHSQGAVRRRGKDAYGYVDGRSLGPRRPPFRVPDVMVGDFVEALDADREGLRPHAALLDARISAALDDLVAGAAGRGAALTRAKAALARDDDEGEDSSAEVRAALLGLVEAASDDAAEARLVRLVAERRKLEVAQARVEQSALDVPLATVALVGEMLRGFGRAQERVLAAVVGRVLTADDLVTLRQATARELDEAGAVGGRSTTRHASDSYLSGWGGEVVIDGEAKGEG